MLPSRPASEEEIKTAGLIHRVYVPEDKSARPTVLMVHGRAGDAQVMWTFSKTFEKQKPLTVAPQAMIADPAGGWSWWSIFDQNGERAKQTTMAMLEPALDRLEKMIEALPALYGADLQQIVALGFSQGAALVAAMSFRKPELFKGVALLAGFIPRAYYHEDWSFNEEVRTANSRPSYLIAHGSEDQVIPVDRAEKARHALEQSGAKVTFVTDPVGHKVGTAAMRALGSWYAELAA